MRKEVLGHCSRTGFLDPGPVASLTSLAAVQAASPGQLLQWPLLASGSAAPSGQRCLPAASSRAFVPLAIDSCKQLILLPQRVASWQVLKGSFQQVPHM